MNPVDDGDGSPLRVAIGEIKQESNSFSPWPTTLADFEESYLLAFEQIIARLASANCEIAATMREPRGPEAALPVRRNG